MKDPESSKRQGRVEMVLAMLICGTIGVTVIASGQSEISLIFYRCLFGALVLLVLNMNSGYLTGKHLSPRFIIGALTGGVALLANWYFLFAAYRNTSIGVATAVYNTQPVIMILLGWLLYKERLSLQGWTWIGMSLLGLVLVSDLSDLDGAGKSQGSHLLGMGQALAAATLYAIAATMARILKHHPPSLIALLQFLLGTVLLWPFADMGILKAPSATLAAAATITLGVVHTGLMYILLYGALQKIPSSQAASISFIYPALAMFIDAVFLDVRLHPAQWIGMLLILIGAAGINLGWNPLERLLPTRRARNDENP